MALPSGTVAKLWISLILKSFFNQNSQYKQHFVKLVLLWKIKTLFFIKCQLWVLCFCPQVSSYRLLNVIWLLQKAPWSASHSWRQSVCDSRVSSSTMTQNPGNWPSTIFLLFNDHRLTTSRTWTDNWRHVHQNFCTNITHSSKYRLQVMSGMNALHLVVSSCGVYRLPSDRSTRLFTKQCLGSRPSWQWHIVFVRIRSSLNYLCI